MADDEPAQGCGSLRGGEADKMDAERRVGRDRHGKCPRLALRLPESARPLRPCCRRPDGERARHFYGDGRATLGAGGKETRCLRRRRRRGGANREGREACHDDKHVTDAPPQRSDPRRDAIHPYSHVKTARGSASDR